MVDHSTRRPGRPTPATRVAGVVEPAGSTDPEAGVAHARTGRVRSATLLVLVGACATSDVTGGLDEPQDATEGLGKGDAPACSTCGDAEAPNILFPGNPACGGPCERKYLAGDDLYVPPANGKPWGETYLLGTMEPDVITGYSSGRIALLRRLALVGDGAHAVMLDPSWEDGKRDFAGRGPEYGDQIVKDWLVADPSRTFLLIYSTTSTGWARYKALADDPDVAAQVSTCLVARPHLALPQTPHLHDALVDPVDWDRAPCL